LSSLDRETVRRVAEHARLRLTGEELDRFAGQLKVVLDAFSELDAVDTSGVEPSYHPVPLENAMRGDEPEPWVWDPFANSRHIEGRHLRGPRIT
jgi:aspartyl-tRNA(Asn)/glutamyl-tRNA(Gln) amidotransferase subunit C